MQIYLRQNNKNNYKAGGLVFSIDCLMKSFSNQESRLVLSLLNIELGCLILID